MGFRETINQIGRTNETLRAANEYQLAKEARDLVDDLIKDESSAKFMYEYRKENNQEIPFTVKLKIGKILSFYRSIFELQEQSLLPLGFAKDSARDFCGLLAEPIYTVFWDHQSAAGNLTDKHKEMAHVWCKK